MASPTGSSAPWTPDGVPPLALALRGRSVVYWSGKALDLANLLAADADLGIDELGSGAVVRSTHSRDALLFSCRAASA
jgi:hypothetical protein